MKRKDLRAETKQNLQENSNFVQQKFVNSLNETNNSIFTAQNTTTNLASEQSYENQGGEVNLIDEFTVT